MGKNRYSEFVDVGGDFQDDPDIDDIVSFESISATFAVPKTPKKKPKKVRKVTPEIASPFGEYDGLVAHLKNIRGDASNPKTFMEQRRFDVDKFISSNGKVRSIETLVKKVYKLRKNMITVRDFQKIVDGVFGRQDPDAVNYHYVLLKTASYLEGLGRSKMMWDEVSELYLGIPLKQRGTVIKNRHSTEVYREGYTKNLKSFQDKPKKVDPKKKYAPIELLLMLEGKYGLVVEHAVNSDFELAIEHPKAAINKKIVRLDNINY